MSLFRRHVAIVTILTSPCHGCGREYLIDVPATGYVLWQEGTPIQAALPGLSVIDRELLLTGTCATCWKATFPVDENDRRW